jgi:DtxR family transcriptional regulator, Mn-dependent transcriptional regulator
VPAAGHSVDEYLETIYFLAFPIGEYTPHGAGSPPLASRVAEMLHVSRASAGEMLKRLEAEGLIERGKKKEALLTETGRDPQRCPHGWPVDPEVEQAENAELVPLATLQAGKRATIVRLAEHDGDLLHWFYDQGLVPGTSILVRAAEPAADQFTVAIESVGERAISEKAAAGLFVRPA